MKVAFFIGSLNRGGAEILVLDTLRKRNTAPFESILIYRNDGDLSDEYRATGVPMFRIKPTGTKLGYVPRLRRLLKKEKVDILHTQTLWTVSILRHRNVATWYIMALISQNLTEIIPSLISYRALNWGYLKH